MPSQIIIDTIKHLKGVDLKTYPYEEIKKQLRNFGNIAVIGVNFNPDRAIHRARINSDELFYLHEHQMSYRKDTDQITSYGRAHRPGQAMFYGAVDSTGYDKAVLMCMYECSSNFGKGSSEFTELVTSGKWIVQKDITVAAMVSKQDFSEANPELLELNKAFNEFITKFPERTEDLQLISEFISYEFGKDVTYDYEYKISAAFTEIALELGVHGILYPSVKAKGYGFNVAIRPDIIDNHTKLDKLLVNQLHARNKQVVINNHSICVKFLPDRKFVWDDVELKHKMSNAEIEYKLNGGK